MASRRSIKCDERILIYLVFGRCAVDEELPAVLGRDRGDNGLILIQVFYTELCISVGDKIGAYLRSVDICKLGGECGAVKSCEPDVQE